MTLKVVHLRTNPLFGKRKKKAKARTFIRNRKPVRKAKRVPLPARRRRAAPGKRQLFIIQAWARGPKGFGRFFYYTAKGRWFSGRARAKRFASADMAAIEMRSLTLPGKLAGAQVVPA